MMRRVVSIVAIAVSFSATATAYVRLKGANGTYLNRPDFANVQMLLNNQAGPGLANASGQTWITPDSDVAGAFQNAQNSWNSVPGSAAQFLPFQSTAATGAAMGTNVVAFIDTPAVQSALGPYTLAFTVNTYAVGGPTDGGIVSSFLYFNPVLTFSSTLVPKTYDLQSVFTHELGHVLGANHSGSIGAAMFQTLNAGVPAWRNISSDDAAFLANVYPATQPASYGSIAGTLTLAGAPLRNALVDIIDTNSGAVLSGLSSGVDGTYSIAAPPGTYYVSAQPIVGTLNFNFYLCLTAGAGCTVDPVDTGFQTGFLGGGIRSIIPVTSGAVSNGDFSPPPGAPALALQYINMAVAGGFADQSALLTVAGGLPVPSGTPFDIIVVGPGIDTTLTDANVSLIGPLTLQPGSVRGDGYVLSNGLQFVRFTVNPQPVTAPTSATLVLTKNGNVTLFPAGLLLLPPPPAPPPSM